MKTLKINNLILAFSLFLTSCSAVNYLGDTFPASSNVDVYYDAKDIKQAYKVIGHLSLSTSNTPRNKVKDKLVEKAKTVGADGIIILQSTGPDDKEMARGDVIKYSK